MWVSGFYIRQRSFLDGTCRYMARGRPWWNRWMPRLRAGWVWTRIRRGSGIFRTSALYGVLFANFIFLPLAAHVQERTDREVLLQRIILEGVIAIGSDLHPRALENKLKSF